MKLPNADELLVERDKIVSCLLNTAHRYSASKAQFFSEFGFRLQECERLAEALREHSRTHEVAQTFETGFGPRYTIEGELPTPIGARVKLELIGQPICNRRRGGLRKYVWGRCRCRRSREVQDCFRAFIWIARDAGFSAAGRGLGDIVSTDRLRWHFFAQNSLLADCRQLPSLP